MTTDATILAAHLTDARQVLAELGLEEPAPDDPSTPRLRPVSGHNTSLLLPCRSRDGKQFVLKFFVPPAEGRFYPPGVRLTDYPRRECAFYRFLDTVDPKRRILPSPHAILIDPSDPPRWILLEWISSAVGPAEETTGIDQYLELLQRLQDVPLDLLVGRRHFPLNHWEVLSYLERARLMYDPILQVIGQRRWRHMQDFFEEARRWTEARKDVVVHGDFTEANVLVDDEGRPFLVDFERIGVGNEDHDFAWLWIHSQRSQSWKKDLLDRYLQARYGSDRIKAEWGIRAALVYLAMRRLRFGFLFYGDADPCIAQNLGLFDACIAGGPELFPR